MSLLEKNGRIIANTNTNRNLLYYLPRGTHRRRMLLRPIKSNICFKLKENSVDISRHMVESLSCVFFDNLSFSSLFAISKQYCNHKTL